MYGKEKKIPAYTKEFVLEHSQWHNEGLSEAREQIERNKQQDDLKNQEKQK